MAGERYARDHEYVRCEDDEAVVGISDYAQDQLGDVVFVELPEIGAKFAKGDQVAVVESVKDASEIYMPVDGEIVAVNDKLEADPGVVNTDPLGAGWLVRIRVANKAQVGELMDQDAYDDFLRTLE